LWRAVLEDFDLEEHELTLLVEAVRTVDVLERLHAVVAAEGEMVTDEKQGRRAHPALVEARQQRIVLARILAALRVPTGDDDDQEQRRRPQRRVGVRGVYALKGSA
jgi:hypothetical protein